MPPGTQPSGKAVVSAAGTASGPALLRERYIQKGIPMNRNVTIGLGTLIIIIIIVALVF
jgi:hypothetical protein